MSELVERGAAEFTPPGNGSTTQGAPPAGTATASGVAAASLNLAITKGQVFVTFQARGADIYIRCGDTATTATTAGNASNGVKIPDGQERSYWITPKSSFVDHIASAAGATLFWWKSSPEYWNRQP